MPLIKAQPMSIEVWVRFQHARRKAHIFVGAGLVLGIIGIVQGWPEGWLLIGFFVVLGVPFELFCRRVKAAQPERFRR